MQKLMRLLLSLLVVSLTLSCSWDGAGRKGEVVAHANVPAFSLSDLEGNKVSLADFSDRVVLLNFWATWCSPCIAEMPSLERLVQLLRPLGFEIIAISVDPADAKKEVIAFKDKHGLSFPILLDPEAETPLAFGVTGFPETFFISGEGKFLQITDPYDSKEKVRVVSDRPWDAPHYIEAIKQLLPKKE